MRGPIRWDLATRSLISLNAQSNHSRVLNIPCTVINDRHRALRMAPNRHGKFMMAKEGEKSSSARLRLGRAVRLRAVQNLHKAGFWILNSSARKIYDDNE